MKEGWYVISGEKCYVQKLHGVWHMWSPTNGWSVYEKRQWSNGLVV
jgi:hypothetical protein